MVKLQNSHNLLSFIYIYIFILENQQISLNIKNIRKLYFIFIDYERRQIK